jgi:hypothetical protein
MPVRFPWTRLNRFKKSAWIKTCFLIRGKTSISGFWGTPLIVPLSSFSVTGSSIAVADLWTNQNTHITLIRSQFAATRHTSNNSRKRLSSQLSHHSGEMWSTANWKQLPDFILQVCRHKGPHSFSFSSSFLGRFPLTLSQTSRKYCVNCVVNLTIYTNS